MRKALGMLCLVAVIATAPASADVASSEGAVVRVQPPGSLRAGAFTSLTHVRLVVEKRSVTLTAPIAVDAAGPGTYTVGQTAPSTLATGSVNNGYLLHCDAPGSATPLAGRVTFEEQVVAVALSDATVHASDSAFRATQTLYPTSATGRGIETGDTITLEQDARSVSFSLTCGTNLDHVRIFTRAVASTLSMEPVIADAPDGRLGPALVAWLVRASDDAPLHNRAVHFFAGDDADPICTVLTQQGVARCQDHDAIARAVTAGDVRATFNGDHAYLPSDASTSRLRVGGDDVF